MTSPTRTVRKRHWPRVPIYTTQGVVKRPVVEIWFTECPHSMKFLASVEPPHRIICPECGRMGLTT